MNQTDIQRYAAQCFGKAKRCPTLIDGIIRYQSAKEELLKAQNLTKQDVVSLVTTLISFAVVCCDEVRDIADNQKKNPGFEQKVHRRAAFPSRVRDDDQAFIDITQAPYQAGLIVDFGEVLSTCGGSLVSSRRVLTAAHCNFHFAIIAKTITVVLGSNYLFRGGSRIETDDITIHPEFNSDTLQNDVAVIRIPRVGFTDQIKPLNLPYGPYNFYGELATASGFGLYSDSSTFSMKQRLNAVNLVVISNEECKQSYGDAYVSLKTICTRGKGGVGTCDGDSGGPLVVFRNNIPILIGITSFGAEMCETGQPSAYTRVSRYIRFITFV